MPKEPKKKVGRPPRVKEPGRTGAYIKLSESEMKDVKKLAEPYKGNVNKLFRVKVLGEK